MPLAGVVPRLAPAKKVQPVYAGGKVFKSRDYWCKCGHLNLVGRWEYLRSTRVEIAPSWRGKCGNCGADLRWKERKRW